ncbi:MAG: Asp-tRNA(Asn)/Glu-tRNA(Gln) amidotransferase subunit GatC [Planctomycetota bacterium]|nr:Asp-tRNA(Asn)/Glu-tRNA(Gln) amidotransferase subunit GatC [Planctomycetota bacterium]
MASSDIETVKRTAALARLRISDAEAERLGRDFARILKAFEGLAGLDVEGARAVFRGGGETAVTRPDEPRPSLPVEEVLGNAPERVEDFYSVPKTVGGEP